mmetsp:Transcript_23346/g.61884  ORF Transcript_23346/g.61884 Transcript_23346/m.61884 type:complete len:430 (-) Transcript_23346:737-2026(-)
MAPRLGLDVVLGIPIRVENDHGVRHGEVDPLASGSGAQKEDEFFGSFFREPIDGLLAVVSTHPAIDPLVAPSLVDQVVLDHVQHPDHLREDQNLVTAFFQLREELVNEDQLTRGLDEVLKQRLLVPVGQGRSLNVFHALDEVRVVAALSQLHHDVSKITNVGGLLPLVEEGEILLQHRPIPLLLDPSEFHTDDGFFLGRDGLLDVLLETAKHVGTNQLLELVGGVRVGHGTKLLGKDGFGHEGLGVHKIQQRPHFKRVVLDRRSRQKHAMGGGEALELVNQPRALVLEPVSLVNHDVRPLDTAQLRRILEHDFIRRHERVPLVRRALLVGLAIVRPLVIGNDLAALTVSVVDDAVHVSPGLELPLPVAQRRQRRDDQERPADVLLRKQKVAKRHRLDGLPQPHLVRQDAPESPIPARDQPVVPFDLVLP